MLAELAQRPLAGGAEALAERLWDAARHVLGLAAAAVGGRDQTTGRVVGRGHSEVSASPALPEIVLDVLGDRDIPVLGNVEFGHAGPNLPMPVGIRVGLDARQRTLSLLEPAVRPHAMTGLVG